MTKKNHDLTAKEQAYVRAALRYLHVRFGTLDALAAALAFSITMLKHVRRGGPVSPALTFRIARLARVPIDDLLVGKFPVAGTCPHCGRSGPIDGDPIVVPSLDVATADSAGARR
ncbi:MAG: hypothetical protein ACHREM_03850 [Polyangiales bacterium]